MREGVTDSLPCGLVDIAADSMIVETNQTFAGWTGISPQELIGRALSDFVSLESSTVTLSEPHLPALGFVVGADGGRRPVLIESGDENDGHRYVVFFDATAQRGFADDLKRRNALTQRTQDRLELVINASIAFAGADTEEELAAVLVDTTAKAFAAEQAVVYLLDGSGEFQQIAGVNPFDELDDIDNLTLQARTLSTVMKITGVDQARALSPSVGRAFEASGVQAMVVAPLHQRDQPLGVLGVFFHHPRQFDEQASPLADALAGQAGRAIANLRLRARLQHAATHDEATGLPNRRLLEDHLEKRSSVPQTLVGVLFIDLDGFKDVNDQLGHYAGDRLLHEVGQRLQESVRDEDLVARYGGDEFVVLCNTASEKAVLDLAERIRAAIAAPFPALPSGLRLTASIGLVVSAADSTVMTGDHLLGVADRAMYSAKLAGGNRVVAGTVR